MRSPVRSAGTGARLTGEQCPDYLAAYQNLGTVLWKTTDSTPGGCSTQSSEPRSVACCRRIRIWPASSSRNWRNWCAPSRRGAFIQNEDKLHGEELSSIAYLRLYKSNCSARVYFVMLGGDIWLLALDANKRQTKMDKNMEKTLCDRLAEVRRKVKEEGQHRGK